MGTLSPFPISQLEARLSWASTHCHGTKYQLAYNLALKLASHVHLASDALYLCLFPQM